MSSSAWPCGLLRNDNDTLAVLLHTADATTLRSKFGAYIATLSGSKPITAAVGAMTRHVQCCVSVSNSQSDTAGLLPHARALSQALRSIPALLDEVNVAYYVWVLLAVLGDYFVHVYISTQHNNSNSANSSSAVNDAQRLYTTLLKHLPVLTRETMTQLQWMRCICVVTQLLRCTAITHNTSAEDIALRCGDLLYRKRGSIVFTHAQETDNVSCEAELMTAMPVPQKADDCSAFVPSSALQSDGAYVHLYLSARGAALQRRGQLLEAARAYTDCFALTQSAKELKLAILCSLLSADTSATDIVGNIMSSKTATQCETQRAYLLERLLQLTRGQTIYIGLRGVLYKAAHMHILRAADVTTLASHLDEGADMNVLCRAIANHNLHALSAVYDNISYRNLALLLLPNVPDVMTQWTEDDAVNATACAIRLSPSMKATIDDVTRRVYFTIPNNENVLYERDTVLRRACHHLTAALDIIIRQNVPSEVVS